MDFDRRNETCLFPKPFSLDIFIKIASASSYLPCEASHLGDSGIVLTINIPKTDGRAEAIVRYRQDGIRYAISPNDATATAKKICNEVPAKPADTKRRRVHTLTLQFLQVLILSKWLGDFMTSNIAGIRRRDFLQIEVYQNLESQLRPVLSIRSCCQTNHRTNQPTTTARNFCLQL